MSIVQIAKIIHRSGNIDQMPQLDTAEIGLAVDYSSGSNVPLHRIFIGPMVPVITNSSPLGNNIELLTQFSGISNVTVTPTATGIWYPTMVQPYPPSTSARELHSNANFYYNAANLTLATDNLAVTANISTGNLIATGNVAGNILISTVAAGTAPLVVSSNTTVANLSAFKVGNSVTFANTGGTVAPTTYNGSVARIVDYRSVGAAQTAGTNYYAIGVSDAANANGMNPSTGTIYGSWSLGPGTSLTATYADLAEYYVADEYYEPGTVLEFGGQHEVTIAEDETIRVAGVVTTHPAYAMNAMLQGEHVVAIALQGRVPCKVRGHIRKGDMMISGGNGYARPTHSPKLGTIIGKSLQDFEGEGVIEIAVGRL